MANKEKEKPESKETESSASINELSEDEKAAFDKIMAQMGMPESNGDENGGTKTKGDQTAEDEEDVKDVPEKKGSKAEPDSDDALEADELEKLNELISQINEDESDSADKPEETADAPEAESGKDYKTDAPEAKEPESVSKDGLDEDQQKALDAIMSQIETGEGDADADNAPAESGKIAETDEPAAVPEKSAEAEEPAAKSGKDSETDVPEDKAPESVSEDGLDDDQQKAFEAIMSQIETGDGDADADNAPAESGKESEADEPEAKEPETGTKDGFDDDQQKAFEAIMSQIEKGDGDGDATEPIVESGKDSDTDAPEVEESESKDSEISASDQVVSLEEFNTELAKVAEEANSIVGSKSETDEVEFEIEKEDTSEQEAALQAIVSELEETDQKNAEASKVVKENIVTSDEKFKDEVTADNAEDPADKKKAKRDKTADVKTDTDAINKDESQSEPAEAQVIKQPENKKSKPGIKKKKKKDKSPKKGKVSKKIIWAVIAVPAIAMVAGVSFFMLRSLNKQTAPPGAGTPLVENVKSAKDQKQKAIETKISIPEIDLESKSNRLKAIGERVSKLRNELIEKQKEIADLKRYYQKGISLEIDALIDELGMKSQIDFDKAVKNQRIFMGLESIQRRSLYIEKLENPLHILTWNSEELLYLMRKADIFEVIAEKSSGLDLDEFEKNVSLIIREHKRTTVLLSIDPVEAAPMSLESIWKTVLNKRAEQISAKSQKKLIAVKDPLNQGIWDKICDGDFSQNFKLTRLSPEAAKCLSKWKGKDLYLNELKELKPEAAKMLSLWKGNWLVLNGLKTLSAESAKHLSRWEGKRLSLNGLESLSPRATFLLSQWDGDQIELIGVKKMGRWRNRYTQIYVSDQLKKKLNIK